MALPAKDCRYVCHEFSVRFAFDFIRTTRRGSSVLSGRPFGSDIDGHLATLLITILALMKPPIELDRSGFPCD